MTLHVILLRSEFTSKNSQVKPFILFMGEKKQIHPDNYLRTRISGIWAHVFKKMPKAYCETREK